MADLVVRVAANISAFQASMAAAAASVTKFEAPVHAAAAKLLTFESAADRAGGRLMDLGNRSLAGAPKLASLTTSMKSFDGALAAMGIHIGPEIRALGELGGAAGKTATQLGLLATAGLSVAAGIGGWKIGRLIADFTGSDKAIGDTVARLLGWDDAAQRAGAKADVLALATRNAGREITSMAEAIKINADAATDLALRWGKSADAARDGRIELAGWQRELRTVRREGNLPQLTADLESQNFSLQTLKTRYGVSVEALQYYVRKTKEASAASKEAAAETKKLADAYQKLISDVNNAAGLAQMEIAAETMKRAAQNAEGLWQMEQDAWKQSQVELAAATAAGEAFSKGLMDEALADDAARNARAAGNVELARTPPLARAAAGSIDQLSDAFNRAAGVIAVGSMEAAAALSDRMIRDAYRAAGFVQLGSLSGLGMGTQGRATGGPVTAGTPYVVGERGQELFVPARSGSIVPNGGVAMGGTTVSITIHGSVLGNKDEIARVVGEAVMHAQRGGGMRLPVGA